MYKLLIEARRVKKILSANVKHNARVENVIDNEDFLLPVAREEFEALCGDLLESRLIRLFDELPKENLPELVIIVGGNTRTPKVQQTIRDYFKNAQIGKFVNADEGAALAALYQAASMVPGFKVKQYLLNEYPREIDPEELEPPTPDFLEDLLKLQNFNMSIFENNVNLTEAAASSDLNSTSLNLDNSTGNPQATPSEELNDTPTTPSPNSDQVTNPPFDGQTTSPGYVDQATPQPSLEEPPHDEL